MRGLDTGRPSPKPFQLANQANFSRSPGSRFFITVAKCATKMVYPKLMLQVGSIEAETVTNDFLSLGERHARPNIPILRFQSLSHPGEAEINLHWRNGITEGNQSD